MNLDSIEIKNFKSCYDTTVKFSPDLTLIVGENNCGKSNIIDALRLATVPLDNRRSRWFERDDSSWGYEEGEIEIINKYKNLTAFQEAQYVTAFDFESAEVQYTTKFTPNLANWRKSKLAYLVGKLKASEPEVEQREKIRHVYLPPLRDVQRELDSFDGHRLTNVIEMLTSETDIDDLILQAKSSSESLDGHTVVTNLTSKLQEHLSPLTSPVRPQVVSASFQTESKLHKLIKNLRIKMAEHGMDMGALSASGMGYANLVFIALVILELENARENELTLFLVEEPEAHLHPQLQVVLLEYLKEHAIKSLSNPDTEEPAGRIQVIATTHSPNLTSITSIENIVALRSVNFDDPQNVNRCTTKAISIKDIEMDDDDVRKVNQYLDVTKCSLLFARSIILVEGTSEAVLLPVIARHSVFTEAEEKFVRAFLGVTLISVGSVDFSPYMKLLLTKDEQGLCLADNLVVITDGDPQIQEEIDSETDEDEVVDSLTNRESTLTDLASELGSDDQCAIFSSEYTLEADLVVPNANYEIIKGVYLKQKPRSSAKWEQIVSSGNPAGMLYNKLRKNKKYLRKGEFAHDLAIKISDGEPFECPNYLASAIKEAVGYNIQTGDGESSDE